MSATFVVVVEPCSILSEIASRGTEDMTFTRQESDKKRRTGISSHSMIHSKMLTNIDSGVEVEVPLSVTGINPENVNGKLRFAARFIHFLS